MEIMDTKPSVEQERLSRKLSIHLQVARLLECVAFTANLALDAIADRVKAVGEGESRFFEKVWASVDTASTNFTRENWMTPITMTLDCFIAPHRCYFHCTNQQSNTRRISLRPEDTATRAGVCRHVRSCIILCLDWLAQAQDLLLATQSIISVGTEVIDPIRCFTKVMTDIEGLKHQLRATLNDQPLYIGLPADCDQTSAYVEMCMGRRDIAPYPDVLSLDREKGAYDKGEGDHEASCRPGCFPVLDLRSSRAATAAKRSGKGKERSTLREVFISRKGERDAIDAYIEEQRSRFSRPMVAGYSEVNREMRAISEAHKQPRAYSQAAIRWLDGVAAIQNLTIRHAEAGGELYIGGSDYVDGYCEATNTVYEFHGCYWHGCPDHTDPDKLHPHKGIPFRECYRLTLAKNQRIRDAGYDLIVEWECGRQDDGVPSPPPSPPPAEPLTPIRLRLLPPPTNPEPAAVIKLSPPRLNLRA